MILVTLTSVVALAGELYDSFIWPVVTQYGTEITATSRVARGSFAVLYYALRSFMAPAYLVLIATISDTTHRLNDNNVVRVLLWAPMIAVFLFIVTNPIHELIFTFEGGMVQRRVFLQVLYAEAGYYSIIGIYWLFRWRMLFSSNEFATLIMLYPIMMAVTVIQYYVQGLRLEMFVTSIAMMLISAFVIHPETRRDPTVGAASLNSYREMSTRAFITGRRLCLVYIEIVNLEKLRELSGRVELQGVIRGVAGNLSSSLERDDVLYYLHNGAFCISSRNLDPEHALAIANKMHERGKAAAERRNIPSTPELRSCVVRIPEDIADPMTLKNFGKSFSRLVPISTVTTYESLSDTRDFDLQMALSDITARAIRDRSFEVYYQPIYCLEDGRFHSAEALVRLNDPEFGRVPPSLFIPEAEQSGTIIEIGAILLEKICAFLASVDYDATGLEYVEVNLSVEQCIRPEMAAELLELMKVHGVDPARVNIEITETSASYSQEAIEKNMLVLANKGITLSLDDFGTGYSNVTRMLSLSFMLVKMDKSFTDNLHDETTRTVLADNVATMKAIGKSVLVEGIETREQAETLREMGVDYIQGYYYAPPMPEGDFIEFLLETQR